MLAIVRKVHIYAGLLTFAHFVVYGIAGVVATLHSLPVRPKIVRQTRSVEFTAPPSSTDRQVADLVFARMHFPLTRPMPKSGFWREACLGMFGEPRLSNSAGGRCTRRPRVTRTAASAARSCNCGEEAP